MPIPKSCRLGYGLMNFTWTTKTIPDEQAFAAIKLAIDSGCTMLNSGEFYSQDALNDPLRGLRLLSRFYKAYPAYVDKTYLSIKGGLGRGSFDADASEENLRASVTTINETLGVRKMDLFEMSRVDQSRSIEDAMRTLVKLRDEGHFKDIGLCEVSAKTLRAAAAIAPIAAVELEYSPWSLDIEHNHILATCKELHIPIAAYCPLGRGFFSKQLKSFDDLPEGDFRRYLDRFQPGNFEKNLIVVDKLEQLANDKGVTLVQLVLAWEIAQWEGMYPIPGSTRVEGVKEALGATAVKLSQKDLKSFRAIVDSADIAGLRWNAQAVSCLEV